MAVGVPVPVSVPVRLAGLLEKGVRVVAVDADAIELATTRSQSPGE
jgi:hypothetical protein